MPRDKYDLIASWIFQSNNPVDEIIWLLKNSFDKVEELEEAYEDVIKHMESEVKNESEV